jgi:acyl-CoA thioesterase I
MRIVLSGPWLTISEGGGMKNARMIQVAIFFFFLAMGSASAQVVALGASNTEGRGVSSSESYPA